MDERVFFLVIGNKEMRKLVGTKEAHIVSSKRGYTVKDVMSSNTFMIKSGNRYTRVKHILDLVEKPLDFELIYSSLPFNSIWSASFSIDMQREFHLGDEQVEVVEKELKLLKIDGRHTKIVHEDAMKVVCYMNSIRSCDDFHSKMDIYPKHVKLWALNNFIGDCKEIGVYCLLDCHENDALDTFMERWKRATLDEVDTDQLIEYINTFFIPGNQKKELLKYLQGINSKTSKS